MKKTILFRYKDIFSIIILLLISFVPFFWLRNNFVLLGHDSGLPLSPISHFTDRLFTWTQRYDSGSDQSFAIGGFFIHGFEAVIALTGLSLSHQQALQFSVYIFFIGLSMYLFCRAVWQEEGEILGLSAAVFYQVNHFIIQAWFIAERTKFSLYIALPILLIFLYKVFYSKQSAAKLGIYSALVLFILNGGGFLPLFAATFLTLTVWSSVLLLKRSPVKAKFSRFFTYFCTAGILSLLLQMYWLLPFAHYVKSNFSTEVARSGGIVGVINWVKSISENTSFLNLIKLQGIQEWYVNAEHPFASYYFNIAIFKFSTYLFIIIFVFIFISRQKLSDKSRYLFLVSTCTAIIALFFMAGSHPPFGFIYIWMIKYIPGFIAFRTPYYKFAPTFFIGFAPLLGYFSSRLMEFSILKKLPFLIRMIIPVFIICVYFFPFFTINYFQYTHSRSTKVIVPDYVYEYGNFSNSENFTYNKTLLLPGNSIENSVHHYDWGYWSLASLESLLDRNNYLSASFGYTLDRKLVVDLYTSLADGDGHWVDLADQLEIDSILVQADFVPYEYKGTVISAETYESVIKQVPRVHLEKEFGKWRFYSFENTTKQIAEEYVLIRDETDQFNIGDFLVATFPQNNIIYSSEDIITDLVKKRATVIFPSCQDCLLKRTQSYVPDVNLLFTPGSNFESFGKFLSFFRGHEELGVPVESYKQLLIIQNSFLKKTLPESRIPYWHEYQKLIDAYQELVNNFLNSYEQSTATNTQLKAYYFNLNAQLLTLKELGVLINRQEEAEVYLSTLDKINMIIKDVEKNVIVTRKKHDNYLLTDITDPGQYDVYVYEPSLNISSYAEPLEYSILFDSKEVVVGGSTDEKWKKVTNQYFSEGGVAIEIVDSTYDSSKLFNDEIKFQSKTEGGIPVVVGQDGECAVIPIGYLDENIFSISFEMKSENGEVEPSIHTVYQGLNLPDLPYWGLKEKISDSSWKRVEAPIAGLNNKFYDFKVCDTKAVESYTVFVRNIEIDRITEPLIALVKQEVTSPSEFESGISQIEKKNNVTFVSKLDGKSSGLLRMPVHYSSNWITNADDSIDKYRINGTQLAIGVREGVTEVEVTYETQRFYLLGCFISFVTMLGSLILLTVIVIRRK